MVVLPRGLWRVSLTMSCILLLYVLFVSSAHAQVPEFRAFWADAFHDGFKTPSQVDQLLSDVRSANCNAVVVQMRRRGDTYYPSPYEPFAADADPTFDALAYLIDKSHNQTPKIEVHAWLCTLPVSQGTTPTDPNHPYNKYPQYLTKNSGGAAFDGSNYCFDPGHPGALDYVTNLYIDVVKRYDVDGIHFDYVRFASNSFGYNDVSVARFQKRYNRTDVPPSGDSAWLQWRRDQITSLVRKVYANAIAIRPNIKVSAATVTWGSGPGSADGWYTTSAYSSVLQDWRAWMEEGILDINMPMAYYREYQYPGYYDNWIAFCKDSKYNRHCAIGPGIYMNSIADSISQYREVRTPTALGGTADGMVGYSYAVTNDARQPFSEFETALTQPSAYDPYPTPLYNTWVPTPSMPWKAEAVKGHLKGNVIDCGGVWLDGATISISGPENKTMVTDGTGFYAFIDLTPGTYNVTALCVGKATKQTQVSVAAGQVVNADFDLCIDPTPAVISNVRAENIGLYTANIKWTTDDLANSRVEYGLTTSYGSMTQLYGAMVQEHNVGLDKLVAGRTYHYRVRSINAAGFETVSGDYSFTTVADNTPPVISDVNVASLSFDEAFITWNTDDPATGQVEYGTTSSYGQSTSQNGAYLKSHGMLVSGLNPATTYHFRVKSMNGTGMASYSADGVFTTRERPSVTVDDTQAVFSGTATWTTASSTSALNGSYRYTNNTKTSASGTCTWTPTITVAGPYDVYCRYVSATDRTAKAAYTINYSGGNVSATVNQQSGGGQWVKIGSSLMFSAGTSGNVQLVNATGETAATKKVAADAVQFVYSSVDNAAPSIPQNLRVGDVTESEITISWDASSDNIGVAGYKVYRDSQYIGDAYGTSFTDSGLQTNKQYKYEVSAFDARNNESGRSSILSVYTLSPAPTPQTVICSKMAGTWYNTSEFRFSNALFGQGKIGYYSYVWDTNPTHAWDDSEWTWAAETITLSAVSGPDAYYFHVKAFNGEGRPSGALDLGPYHYDGAPPVVGTVSVPKYLAVRGADFENLGATWTGSDAESGIIEYKYAIGTAPGGTNIMNWTSSGTDTFGGCVYSAALEHEYNYYFSVKAVDRAGNWSNVALSGPSVYANVYRWLAEAMNNPNGKPVIVDENKILSAVLDGYCYIQEPDRSRGIRINTDCSLSPGSLARVAGKLGVVDGERVLTDVVISPVQQVPSPGDLLKPLLIGIATIGGVSPDPYTPGIAGSWGCYNLGLLVRTAGRVSSHGNGFFVISDGSGEQVKVYSSFSPSDNAFVGVTGVSGVETGGVRVIRTRYAGDVQVY